MRRERLPAWNATGPMRRVAARTVMRALEEIVPLVAVTVPARSSRPAVKTARPRSSTVTDPSAAGVTRQRTVALVGLPNWSVDAASRRSVPRARTWADVGVTATAAAGPAATEIVCVPAVTPTADAVSVWLPTCVSR